MWLIFREAEACVSPKNIFSVLQPAMRNPLHLPSLFYSLPLRKLEISIPRQVTQRHFFSHALDCAGKICLGRREQVWAHEGGRGAREV